MKLTVELVARTDSFLNPLKDRELDLRGLKIPAIENLGATKDGIDSLDLSDNAIISLSNLPKLVRLTTLNLANNPIAIISPNVGTQLPYLKTLILTGTQLKDLSALTPLFNLKKLEFLSLSSTPIAQQDHYRSWIIHNMPSVRWLDYSRVKQKERDHARTLFVEKDGETATDLAIKLGAHKADSNGNGNAAASASSTAANTFDVGGEAPKAGKGLTEEQKQRIRKAIEKATTLDEIQRLKRMLADGFIQV